MALLSRVVLRRAFGAQIVPVRASGLVISPVVARGAKVNLL